MAGLTHRVTGFGGRVAVLVSATSSVRIKVGTDAAVTAGVIFSPAVTPDSGGYAKCTVAGLTPGVRYYYRVAMTDSTTGTETLDTSTTVGRIQVAPSGPSSFTFDFASCCNAADSASMSAIAARNDDFFLHVGDLFYDDAAAPSVANYQNRFGAKFAVANHLKVFSTMPTSFIPSDHDFSFANNGNAASDPTAGTQYNQVYRQMMPMTPVPATTGIYHTFVWGRVRFILLDCRSFSSAITTADSASKTMLGATQKTWFKNTITAATEPVIVVAGDTAWTGPPSTLNDDSWDAYNTERQELATFMKAQAPGKRFVYIAGDMHALAANDGTLSGYGIPSFQGSPLNNTASIKGGDWTSGPYPASGAATTQAYGRVVVTDSGTSISLAYTGYTSDNVSRVTQTNTFAVSGTTTAISASRGTTWRSLARATGTRAANWGVLASLGTISVSVSTRAIWSVAAPVAPLTKVLASRSSTWNDFAAQGSIAVETWNGTAGAPWPAQWTIGAPATPAQPVTGAVAGTATINGAQQGQLSTAAEAFAVSPTEYLSGMPLTRDCELVVDAGFDTFTADGYVGISLRSGSTLRGTSDYVTANGYYLALVNEPVAGTGGAWEVGRVVGGVKTVLQRTAYTFTTRVRVRVQLLGASVAVRVWNVGATEPTAWGYAGTDPSPYLADGRLLIAVQAGAAAAARVGTFENLTIAPVTLGRVNTTRATTWTANATPQQFFYSGFTQGFGPAAAATGIRTVGNPAIYENATSTGAVVPVPPGTTVGDLLVATISQASGAMIGTPIAWQMLGHAETDGASIAMFGRFATTAEPPTYTFPAAPEAGPVSGIITRVAGVTAAILDVASVGAVTAAPTTVGLALPSVTTVSVNTLLLSAYTVGTTNAAFPLPPTTMTQVAVTTGSGQSTAVASEFWQPAGPTDVRRWSINPATVAYQQAGVTIALRSTATATSAIEATRTLSWRTSARVAETRTVRWATSGAAGVTRVVAEVRTSWSANSAAVFASVTRSVSTQWTARARTVSARTASWSLGSLTLVGAPLTARPNLRLRVYAPNGSDLGPLPAPQSVTVAYPLDDVGSLSLSYLRVAPRSSLLGQPCEIAVEVSPDSGVNWLEPPDSRFIYISDGMDPRDPAANFDVEARSFVWALSKARVLPNGLLNADGKRAFLSVSPGVILKTLFTEAQARGAMQGVTHASFTTGADSAGVPWANRLTIYYEPGLDYLALLRDLSDQGFIDFRMQGRSLEVYNADTVLARDRSVGAGQVVFLPGRDITEAPFRRTWEGLASYAYFAGDRATYEFTNPAAATPWGRWETFISNGSVTDPGTMAALTQAELSLGEQERVEYTRGLDFTRAFSRPFWDYRVGDYVWTTVDGQSKDRLRIRQLTLTMNERGIVAGNVVLNDRFLEADVRQKRRIEGITNGASSGAGGSTPGDPTTGTTPASMPPAKVGGLIGSSVAFLGPGGFPQAQVTLSWAAVTTNSDGTPIDDFDHYEIFQRPAVSDITTRRQIATTTETDHSMSPYQTGSNWLFSVRAVDTDGNRGVLSNEVAVGMARDTIPPQAPSAPTVTDNLGTLLVRWDGKPATGLWPADFSYVEVHTSPINNFTPSTATLVHRLYSTGNAVLTDLTYGDPVYAKLVAVDTSDLHSVASAQGVGTPHRLVGSDIDPGAITYEQIGFKDPGNLILDGSFESQAFRDRMTAQSNGWLFTTATAYHGNYSATADGSVNPGTFRFLSLMDRNVDVQQIMAGEKLFCRYAYNVSSGASGTLQLAVQWINPDNVTLSYSLLNATLKNGTWQQAAGQLTAPAGVASFRIYLQLRDDVTLGVHSVDAIEVRRTVGTSIIQDAAIENAQIANLAVNSAKISALDVGKLTAGTLNASILLGNQISTATAGSRVEMTPTGIRLYDAAGAVKAWLNPAVGQLRTYSTGDLTHTSVTHGLQIGNDNGENLAMDSNEIMARFNGSYGTLLLNREGGSIALGGKPGGYNPDGSDLGVVPATDNHHIQLRGSVEVQNSSDGGYNDLWSPLMVGPRGGAHLWFDANEIGAADGRGGTSRLYIMPTQSDGSVHFTETMFASNSLMMRRVSAEGGGNAVLTGWDSGHNIALQFFGSGLLVRNLGLTGYNPITASAFTVASERQLKHKLTGFDALDILAGAPAQRWQYTDDIEEGDFWHHGPMVDDLPDHLVRVIDGRKTYDVASLVGVLWEAVRHVADKVERLEAQPHADQP